MNSARTYADELLARFTEPATLPNATGTPAKAAKAAKPKHSCGLAGDSTVCEGLRIAANPARPEPASDADSQTFAGVRNPANGPQSEQRCGFSQDSQDSQGVHAKHARPYRLTKAEADRAHEQPWTEEQIARFLDRRARLMRWGWSEVNAEDMAERIALHDIDGDDRVICAAECRHYRPGRCGNHRAAGLATNALGRQLAMTPQRCDGFSPSGASP